MPGIVVALLSYTTLGDTIRVTQATDNLPCYGRDFEPANKAMSR